MDAKPRSTSKKGGLVFSRPQGMGSEIPIEHADGWTLLTDLEKQAQFLQEVGLGPIQEAARESQVGGGGSCRYTGAQSQGPATFLSRVGVGSEPGLDPEEAGSTGR